MIQISPFLGKIILLFKIADFNFPNFDFGAAVHAQHHLYHEMNLIM